MAIIDYKLVTKIHDLVNYLQNEYSDELSTKYIKSLPDILKRNYTAALVADAIVPSKLVIGIYVPTDGRIEKVAIIKKFRSIVQCSLREAVDVVNDAISDAYKHSDRVGTCAYIFPESLRYTLFDDSNALMELRNAVEEATDITGIKFMHLE